MSDSLLPKAELPVELAVMICEVRQGHLWPLTRIDQRTDGLVHVVSGRKKVGRCLGVLQQAFDACLRAASEETVQAVEEKLRAQMQIEPKEGGQA